ncbi:MAG: dnaG [Burkholderiales bacterium]|jgi:DNA primase|nr:dnaG [Burkholderiales bacterium]
MQIDQTVIDEIISRADIVDVIGRGLKLKRSGNNYFACCPFHKEKTASFSINAKEQYFHCFGCGESGNVITYVMKYNGLDFIETLKSLASTYGVHIPDNAPKKSKAEIEAVKIRQLTLRETINKSVEFYRQNLKSSNTAMAYFKNRGLTQSILDKFLLGYVPNQSNALSKVFADYHNNKFLQDAGLVVDNGKLYDRFRDRVMFPLRNVKGEVIAFGGRITGHGEPKYLNSPETTLFNKSDELYGLYESQRQIRDKNSAIVVEGYMDVIALFQFGIDNVVATMGTAATEEHVKKLFRICDDIYYCFDGDSAGQKAAWRALERSIALVTDTKAVHFLFLPKEHDPDSFIRQYGVDAFRAQAKNNALSLSAFLLKQLSSSVSLNHEEGKARLISLAKPYIAQVKAAALAVMLKKQLAGLVDLTPDVVENILNNRSRYAFYNNKWNKTYIPDKVNVPVPFNLLNLIIIHACEHIDWVINYILPDNIEKYSRDIQELVLFLDYIGNHYSSDDTVEIDQICSNIEFSALNIQKERVKSQINLTEEEFRAHLDKIFGLLKTKAIRIPRISMPR